MLAWEPTPLTTRDGLTAAAEQATLDVPILPGSLDTYRLKMVRLRASNPLGPPVVFLSGGPGDSGIQWASHGPFLRAFLKVTERCDVILLDQRGAGASEPDLRVPLPEFAPDDLASEEAMFALAARHLPAVLAEKKIDPKSITPVQSAHDLEAIRVALAVPEIQLWGYSYGTHLAQTAARLHPSSFLRIVLCGFEGPDQTLKLPSQMDAQLHRLNQLFPGFLGDLGAALAALDREPAEVGGLRLGGFALRHLVAGWCGISNRFGRLPTIAAGLAQGDVSALAANLKDYLKLWQRPLTFYLNDAASSASPARLAQIEAEAPTALLQNAANFPFPAIGPLLGAGDIGASMREPLETDIPMMVLTGSLDGFTPTANAEASLNKARHIVIENAAHNDLMGGDGGVTAIAAFFADGSLPPFDRLSVPRPTPRN